MLVELLLATIMAELTFYTNPQSRGRIVRWMLEEVDEPYVTEIVTYDEMKSDRYLAVNPMGKVPAIKHRDHTSPQQNPTRKD